MPLATAEPRVLRSVGLEWGAEAWRDPHPAQPAVLGAGEAARHRWREALTSSGVSLASGWPAAARRARLPARMLLRLIWRSGGGPPRGCPRTMMAQPDSTCGEAEGLQGVPRQRKAAGRVGRTDRLPGMDPAPGTTGHDFSRGGQSGESLLPGAAGWSQAPQRYLSNAPSPPSEHSATALWGDLSAADNTRDLADRDPGTDPSDEPSRAIAHAVLAAERSEPGARLHWAAPSHPIPSHSQGSGSPIAPRCHRGTPVFGRALCLRHRGCWHGTAQEDAGREKLAAALPPGTGHTRGGTCPQPAGPEGRCSWHEGFNPPGLLGTASVRLTGALSEDRALL